MKKWEDIVKDRLEGYESALPEGSLAAFRARRSATSGAPVAKRFPMAWVVAGVAAAGLAAVLLLRKPDAPEDGIQLVQQPPVVQVPVDDTSDIVTPIAATPLIAQATPPKIVRQPASPEPEEIVPSAIPEETIPAIEPETPVVPETEEVVPEDAPVEPAIDKPVITDSSPFVPQSTREKAVKVNVGPGAVVAGGGLAAALATQLAGINAFSPDQIPYSDDINDTNQPGSESRYLHRMPVVVGLSTRISVTEKLGITTGLEYSMYTSLYTHPRLSGSLAQYVHYLGIPVRLDWSPVSGRWFDAYLGAGVKGDFCLGATYEDIDLGKDGPAFRLLGAGGIQFNATRHLGLYVEPTISWTLPSERRMLSTYSSEHPWMFTVATGIRVNFGK